MAEQILVIEDEEDIREILRYNLEREGFEVACAATGEEGLAMARARVPDMILLDLMLPGIQGIEVCRRHRKHEATASVMLIIVSAKGEEADVVSGLEMGADDYVTKPFSPRELAARIRSALRRGRTTRGEAAPAIVTLGALELDPGRHEARVQGEPIELTLAEFRLLNALSASPGRVFTRAQLIQRITGGNHHIVERNVDVHVRSVRKKLGEHGDLIRTVRGVGYKIDDD